VTKVSLTVFTTFYDNINYLDETVASVLTQSFRDFEYLIINDGDAAHSERIRHTFPDPRIRLINEQRLGRTRARQRGLELASGEYIAMIDSDDFCEPERLAKQMKFLGEHSDHVLVGSALRYVDEQSQTIGYRSYPIEDEEIKRKLLVFNCVAQPSVIARREALLAAGGYNEQFHWAEDYDLWLRLGRLGKFHNLPEALVAYRIHLRSGKNVYLKLALRDTTRLKVHALRHYGYRLTPAAALSIVLHTGLRALPASVIWRLFTRFVASRNPLRQR
jgi:glycosyltransferase involved in cell wall biosynthesis